MVAVAGAEAMDSLKNRKCPWRVLVFYRKYRTES